MNHWNGYWVIPLALLAAPALTANKCVETGGRIFYQAAPCPANTRGGDMHLNVNRPFTGQAKPPATTYTSTTSTATTGEMDPPDQPGQDQGEPSLKEDPER